MLWTHWITRLMMIGLAMMAGVILLVMMIGLNTPVGQQIAYVSKQDGAVWDVHLMDIDRRLSYNVTRPYMADLKVRNRLPTWSPDGEMLAFVSEYNRRQGMDILLLHPSSGQMRVFADSPQDETLPVWSPLDRGASRLAYSVFNGRSWDIHVQRAYETDLMLVQNGGGGGSRPFIGGPFDNLLPRWSPDGNGLLFASNRDSIASRDLYIVDNNGRNLHRLTHAMDVGDYVEWSPNGAAVAFVSRRAGNREIYVVNVVTGVVSNLSQDSGDDYAPVWSPDGAYIAFVSNRGGSDDIYLMTRDGEDLRRLTYEAFPAHNPVWSPDGTQLLYVAEPDFTSELFIMTLETGEVRRLTHNSVDDWSPIWRP